MGLCCMANVRFPAVGEDYDCMIVFQAFAYTRASERGVCWVFMLRKQSSIRQYLSPIRRPKNEPVGRGMRSCSASYHKGQYQMRD